MNTNSILTRHISSLVSRLSSLFSIDIVPCPLHCTNSRRKTTLSLLACSSPFGPSSVASRSSPFVRLQFQVNNVSVLSTFVKYLSKEICLSLPYSRYIVSDRTREMPILSTETVESKSTEVKNEKNVDLKDVKDGARRERE